MVKRVKHYLYEGILSVRLNNKPKKICALIRVKNGAEYLDASIESISSSVDEIVIVNNLSTDNTEKVITEIKERHPLLVATYNYNYEIARVGEEYNHLMCTSPTSERLASVYYNWCLKLCSSMYVLKWDDDMVATKRGNDCLREFKKSKFLRFDFGGENISPNFESVLTWKAGVEPRVFPRLGHTFTDGNYSFIPSDSGEKFGGEALASWIPERRVWKETESLYAHLKYCKNNPTSNQSPQFAKKLQENIQEGGAIADEFKAALSKYLKIY